MVVLFHGIDDALTGSEVDGALAGDSERGGPALRGVFAFGFDGDFRLAPDIEFALSIGLLVDFASFGRRGDGVKHAAFGDAGFDVLGDQLIAVARDPYPGILRCHTGNLRRRTWGRFHYRCLTHNCLELRHRFAGQADPANSDPINAKIR